MISENEKEIDQKTQGCMSTSEEKKNQFNSTLQKIYPKEQIVLFNHEKVKIELKKTLEKPIKLEKIFNIKEMKVKYFFLIYWVLTKIKEI